MPGLIARLRSYFPDHELHIRSGGKLRFVRITSNFQLRALAIVGLALFGWLAFTLLMIGLQLKDASDRVALDHKAQQVAASEHRVEVYHDSVENRIARVAHRQQMLDALVERHFGNLDIEDDAVAADNDTDSEHAMASGGETGNATLATLEAHQFAFASRLRGLAEHRAEQAADAIREFGLDPDVLSRQAMGGPFIPVARGHNGADEAVLDLEAALNHLTVMELSLSAIPSAKPTHIRGAMTSPFGVRYDPINGTRTIHSGIDFRGIPGQGILATGAGRVIFAGRRGGYGNCIEIDHGAGVVTRYGHLSAIEVRLGQQVDRGDRIGRMGSTGRSTGTHLHYEVRINDRAVNPRPLLEADSHVLEIQSFAERRNSDAVERG